MSRNFMYILECANGAYYTGSTKNLERRLEQHQAGEGANFTKKHLPVTLVYYEEYQRIADAFYREKQVQGLSRKKKEALINGKTNLLHELAECKNETHFKNFKKDVSATLNALTNRSLSEVETSEVETSETPTTRSLSEVETSEVETSETSKS